MAKQGHLHHRQTPADKHYVRTAPRTGKRETMAMFRPTKIAFSSE